MKTIDFLDRANKYYNGNYITGKDCTPVVKQILEGIPSQDEDGTILNFDKKRYDFYPNESEGEQAMYRPFSIGGKNNFTIEGNGSEFVFHGQMAVFAIDESSQITLKNFSIDWEHPLIIQADVESCSSSELVLRIDKTKYDFYVENGYLKLRKESGVDTEIKDYSVSGENCNWFDSNYNIVQGTRDSDLQGILAGNNAHDEGAISGGSQIHLVRFTGRIEKTPPVGTHITIRLKRGAGSGELHYWDAINIAYSRDVTLQNVHLYHAMQRGIMGGCSMNIKMDNSCAMIKPNSGRCFSTNFDNAHFNNCQGTIEMTHCTPTGMGDDALNVHGRYYQILGMNRDECTVDLKISDAVPRNKTNDSLYNRFKDDITNFYDYLCFVKKDSMIRSSEEYLIKGALEEVKDQETGEVIYYKATFVNTDKNNNLFPLDYIAGDFMENATWVPEVNINNCTFDKKNRARGILVSTPKRIIISNNTFKTAGAAIFIAADNFENKESGGTDDVAIMENVFDNCLTSGRNDDETGEWGDAVVTIRPNNGTENLKGIGLCHKSIVVQNNLFNAFDAPLVYGCAIESFKFIGNTVHKSPSSVLDYAYQRSMLHLYKCKNVEVSNTIYDEGYPLTYQNIIEMDRFLKYKE